jgi:hypothetical protein
MRETLWVVWVDLVCPKGYPGPLMVLVFCLLHLIDDWEFLSREDREKLRRDWYSVRPGVIPPEGTPNKKELGDEIDLNEFLKYLSFLDVVPLDPPLDWKPSAQPLVQERRRSGGME